MKNFKIEVSKGLEKFTFIRQAEAEILLRETLHKEGFTILSISQVDDVEISGNKFYFEFLKDGILKTGTISSNDIFKAYLKIKYGLGYDLKYIYQNQETTQSEKEKLIYSLQEQYRIYSEANKKQNNLEEAKTQERTKIVKEEEKVDSFQMKKELDETYRIIDKVLFKIKNFIEKENEFLDADLKEKLKVLFNELIKIKNSTNITKLKEIGELGLTKIGEIELKILGTKKDEESRRLLNETNNLLKNLGSHKKFVDESKDLKVVFNNFLKKFDKEKKTTNKFEIDKKGMTFLKTKLLYEKYQLKNKILQKEKIKNFLVFIIPGEKNTEIKENILLREKVLKQNILILKSRLTQSNFSYSKIIKGYNYFVGKILDVINFFKTPILIFDVIYSFLFVLMFVLNYFNIIKYDFNYSGIFYFIFINLIVFLLSLSKGMKSLIFNIVFLTFLFIFGVINF